MKIGCLQLNATVGDFEGNATRLLRAYEEAIQKGAELVLAPELFLSGYPPRDWLSYPDFLISHDKALERVLMKVKEIPLIVGILSKNEDLPGKALRNSVAFCFQGKCTDIIHKTLLPTYDVFDEDRYFEPGTENQSIEWKGKQIGLTVCEDIWNDQEFWQNRLYNCDPVKQLCDSEVDLLLNVSASPWHLGKEQTRNEMLEQLSKNQKIPVVQVNLVGGNDELIFDGRSLVFNQEGKLLKQGKAFEEDVFVVDTEKESSIENLIWPEEAEQMFHALVLGVRDYTYKCGFKKAVLGLSGGIDSALTAVIATEALGAENVLGVLMPSPFSSSHSVEDAKQLAQHLNITYEILPIKEPFQAVLKQLDPVFKGAESDVTEENIQARLRGVTLMAISNKQNRLLLTTGNKSELAAGYCTLYGDMCGGLAVISDVAKMQVYEMSRWVNRDKEIIPWNTIEKPPSAELRPNQTDQDSLPPYEIFDAILEGYLIDHMSIEQIVASGFDEDLVRSIIKKVDINEYKRKQAAPGLKVTSKAFGIGRRMPIAQRFRSGS